MNIFRTNRMQFGRCKYHTQPLVDTHVREIIANHIIASNVRWILDVIYLRKERRRGCVDSSIQILLTSLLVSKISIIFNKKSLLHKWKGDASVIVEGEPDSNMWRTARYDLCDEPLTQETFLGKYRVFRIHEGCWKYFHQQNHSLPSLSSRRFIARQ